MGNNQSRLYESDSAMTEKLAERLRAMQVEHERDGYLIVENQSSGQSSFINSLLDSQLI
jgi:hypothetical protein